MYKKSKIYSLIFFLVCVLALSFRINLARAQLGPLVGGRFLPGLFDIFTPTPTCGLLVSVVGPNPGVFVWAPTTYNYFNQAVTHVGLQVLGMSFYAPPCAPILSIYGTSLIP
jgi:hypothetical protein